MLFSIIIPVYNVENYIDECIQSILNQTEQDFEIIIINDGSTDNSGNICDAYAKIHQDKIKVFHFDNSGIVSTRRKGIRKAEGDFLLFVDSDDYLELDALKILKQTVDKYNCDLVMFNFVKLLHDGTLLKNKNIFNNEEIFENSNKKKLYTKIIEGSSLNNLCNKAVKRTIVDINEDYNNYSFVRNGEDLLQLLPIITNAEKVVFIDKDLYVYRQYSWSMSHRFNENKFASIKAVGYKVHQYLTYWNMNEEDKLRLYETNLNSITATITQLMSKSCKLIKQEKIEYLSNIAKDDFFINAYNNAIHNSLNYRARILLKLITKRKFKTALHFMKLIDNFSIYKKLLKR